MPAIPAFGWTFLSRKDIQRAEAQLHSESDGVRDEIGFLALHQAYADRFFPGTSVLHTRLRYVLFIPWLFQRLSQVGSNEPAASRLREEERKLVKRLNDGNESGVIGGRVYPNAAAATPSMVYWTAMQNWGLLIPRPDDTYPVRSNALRWLDANRRMGPRLMDDDRQLLAESRHVFVTVPKPPKEWDSREEPLDFHLRPEEQRFLRTRLAAVARLDDGSTMSLLARLAESGIDLRGVGQPWMRDVLAVADKEDQEALVRARQAASLAAVGRAVYSALVEDYVAQDGLDTSRAHRNCLERVVQEYRADALALDIGALKLDEPKLATDPIIEVLTETQQWLRSGKSYMALAGIYESAEQRRKGVRRARLGSAVVNRERRLEWNAYKNTEPKADPLHYRWLQVRRLLLDLKGVA